MTDCTTIATLLEAGADGAPAIGAPGSAAWLPYRELRALAARTIERLNGLGIGRDDRVAIVLHNGPEMATAFVAIGAGAATAPLNPAYRAEDFARNLSDLRAKAIVVEDASTGPAVAVAHELGLPILDLRRDPGRGPGAFTLAPRHPMSGRAARPGPAGPDDTALVLHTSGTTSRPKIVPLLQRNVVASARNIGATLALGPDDVCLNVMPLFHIHGLMAATLASLAAGARVSCCPGFNALRFFAWIDEVRPTWYTAVPSMHQAILARADRHRDSLERLRLRFVRSASASLPPQVLAQLEATFRAPVVEAYGMTEASHQMASNPLPPRARKPGSVGPAAGPEIAIMDERGALLGPGEVGEVVIRGPSVMSGYEANPEANASAFTGGWFRTGDQGVLDGDGYLRLTGRLKELINCGGEKVSPLEVDEALMHHPAVQQVVAFAMPHHTLGEGVAAAVVLREGMEATERELRAFAATRVAHFKVPRRIVIVPEIPKGATGKLERIGLAAKLGVG